MHLLSLVALLVFARGAWGKYRAWRAGCGSPVERMDHPGKRLAFMFVNAVGQVCLLKKPLPGILHFLLFWGFVCFGLGTFSVMLKEEFGLPTFQGSYYLWLSLFLDVFAVLALTAVFMALVMLPEHDSADIPFREQRRPVLLLVGAILVTGLLLEGLRMAVDPDPWRAWSPAGWLVSSSLVGMERNVLRNAHQGMWWFHLLLSLGLIALVPYTCLFHLLAAPASQFFGNPEAAKALPPIDFKDETIVSFGVGKISDFNWKHLLELDACTNCGRCHDQCPAVAAGKPLSPEKLNRDLKRYMQQTTHLSMAREKTGAGPGEVSSGPEYEGPRLVGEVVPDATLWACTTCGACEVSCPVVVEHVPRIIDMRRHLVMMEARIPPEARQLFCNLENQQNPWGMSRAVRPDWAKGLDVPLAEEDPDAEFLFWPGCAAAYDPRNQKVARALVEIMRQGAKSFAILGKGEKCCGDPARRLGNEDLFQTLARQNIETLHRCNVKKIITSCPHCFNTLKNEYPRFGGQFQLIHHSELIRDLIDSGSIRVSKTAAAEKITYHDSCYLGRYNRIFEAPRAVLGAVAAEALLEMPRHGRKSFCCGGGGGLMWMDDHTGAGPNLLRAREAVECGADLVATACPYCLNMLVDGFKHESEDGRIRTADIAEIVAEGLIRHR